MHDYDVEVLEENGALTMLPASADGVIELLIDPGPPMEVLVPGVQGPPGIVWKGNWDWQADYQVGESVSYGGVSWVAYVDPPAGEVPPSHPEHWQMVADKGQQGEPGTIQPVITLQGASQFITSVTTIDDGTDTANWPNRWEWNWKPVAGTKFLVQWTNEYGELRGTPAKYNTVAARWFAKNANADQAHSGPVIEVQDSRTNRTPMWGVNADGTSYGATPTASNHLATKGYLDGRSDPVKVMTQAAYDALGVKDPNTVYVIT